VFFFDRESELRLTPEVQEAYARTGGAADVTINVQKQVAEEFGFPNPEVGIDVLRTAESRFPDDAEIKELSHYRKFNRCKQGDLELGQAAPDVQVYDLDGKAMSIFDGIKTKEEKSNEIEFSAKRRRINSDDSPIVLIAGSYS